MNKSRFFPKTLTISFYLLLTLLPGPSTYSESLLWHGWDFLYIIWDELDHTMLLCRVPSYYHWPDRKILIWARIEPRSSCTPSNRSIHYTIDPQHWQSTLFPIYRHRRRRDPSDASSGGRSVRINSVRHPRLRLRPQRDGGDPGGRLYI